MLNEHFELISVSAALRLPEPKDSAYRGHALRLLEAQRNLAGNRMVPLTGETLDCLLGSMLDVNIKHLIRHGGSWQDFLDLYGALTDNLVVLLKQHSNLMSDRAAQLSALCQDLVQAIVGYRAERKQAQDLSETELDGLADLGLKLATVMATVATTQALAVKRVAPFLLIFTIRQMVATERPTTLFEKVCFITLGGSHLKIILKGVIIKIQEKTCFSVRIFIQLTSVLVKLTPYILEITVFFSFL